MCRFLAYLGKPIVLDKLLYQPKNSLVHQSYHAQERKEPLNGDGFGVGYYVPELDPAPALFVSTTPAWSNRNLRYNAPKMRSHCIFAHVRAASSGEVAEMNCHPFQYDKLLFMHNGQIGGFKIVKRKLRQRLSDELYNWIQGTTDSEHFFALFLNNLLKKGKPDEYSAQDFANTLEEIFAELRELLGESGIDEPSFMNVAITNGKCIVATRCTLGPSVEAATLYHSEGTRFECDGDVCRMVQAGPAEHAVLVVSEKLTEAKEDWREAPKNHMIIVNENLTVALRPIKM